MKIVIDVPEERYKDIQRIAEVQLDRRTDTVEQIVAKGTPIEKTDGDLISRADLLNKIWQKEYGTDYDGVNLLNIKHIDIIEQMPSAEKTAEWKAHYNEKDHRYSDLLWFCTNCGERFVIDGKDEMESFKYCPNCGAKMKESEEEE